MKKTKKKNLKGMTLFEMIISIAIFAIMGGLLIMVGMHIDNMQRASTNLKNKVVKESPYAANHITKYTDSTGTEIDLPRTPMEIQVSVTGEGSYAVAKDPSNPAGEKEVREWKNPAVSIEAEKFGTVDIAKDGLSSAEQDRIDNGPNNGLNLEFVEFVTTATTTAPGGVVTTTTGP